MAEEKILLNQKEVAAMLGTTVSSMNSLRSYGKLTIPHVMWGNRIRFKRSDVEAWIAANTKNKIEEVQK